MYEELRNGLMGLMFLAENKKVKEFNAIYELILKEIDMQHDCGKITTGEFYMLSDLLEDCESEVKKWEVK